MAECKAGIREKDVHHKKRHGRRAPQYLDDGSIIKDVYRIEKLIGGGGFGQIYRVIDLRTRTSLAIKMETDDHEPGRMIFEQKVLLKLRGQPHIPLIYASGHHACYNFIVMQILGKNISELRKRQIGRRFTVGTAIRIGCQCVMALKTLQDGGFIHRDIKPSNFCIGIKSQSRTIFLIDFGMARLYRQDNGIVRKERYYAGFRGTVRYVSLTVHERRDQGPADDFWSLFYSIIELIEGILPWSAMNEPDDVAKTKKNIMFEEFGRRTPKELEEFSTYLYQLSYDQAPDYSTLVSILKDCLPKDITDITPFDWEATFDKIFEAQNW